MVASAGATARQAQQATASGISGSPNLASASQAAREAVHDFQDAYFKDRKFDPYLQFASAEDERKFRERENERQEAIQRALAQNSPEGNLKANQLALDQLKDAGAHGATRSPEYETMRKSLQASQDDLSAAITSSQPAPSQTTSKASAAPGKDIADDVAPAAVVPQDVIAALRATGVKPTDPQVEGHGVAAAKPQDRSSGLSA